MLSSGNRPSGRAISIVAAALGIVAVGLSTASAQLRIVTYNTTGAPRTDMDVVLRSMGEETVNGIARPIDVLLLGEQENSPLNQPSDDTAAFANLLNTMYAGQMHGGQNVTYD